MKLIAGALITAVLLAVVPNNSVAATKYKYNTYKQGYSYITKYTAHPIPKYVYSASTGKFIYKQAIKYCTSINYGDGPVMSPNARKGCADAIKNTR
jgi:hypothetical protein